MLVLPGVGLPSASAQTGCWPMVPPSFVSTNEISQRLADRVRSRWGLHAIRGSNNYLPLYQKFSGPAITTTPFVPFWDLNQLIPSVYFKSHSFLPGIFVKK